jgi:hypothetical protein
MSESLLGKSIPPPFENILLGEYPKNSDNYPNTSGVLNTFKYTVRAQRD